MQEEHFMQVSESQEMFSFEIINYWKLRKLALTIRKMRTSWSLSR